MIESCIKFVFNIKDSDMGISLNTIPAKRGKAVYMTNGQTIKIINTHGKQVIDTWAFNANDLDEYMSMEHSRTTILKLIPL